LLCDITLVLCFTRLVVEVMGVGDTPQMHG